MGYRMHQTGGKFRIKAAQLAQALEAAIEVGVPERRAGLSGTTAEQLAELFRAWGWRVFFEERTGDVADIQFTGEKYGDDDELFRAIAPHVEAGSHLYLVGEDDESWRWYFDGQEMITQPGPARYAQGKVVVEVRGGVAEVTSCPCGIEVQIIDRDHREAADADRAA